MAGAVAARASPSKRPATGREARLPHGAAGGLLVPPVVKRLQSADLVA